MQQPHQFAMAIPSHRLQIDISSWRCSFFFGTGMAPSREGHFTKRGLGRPAPAMTAGGTEDSS